MKICVVGLGSIGKRHINNIVHLLGERETNLQIDLLRSGKNNNDGDKLWKYIHSVYYNPGDLPEDYDAIFITNPTSMHYETLCSLQEKGRSFFIEKPVFSSTEVDLSNLSMLRDKVCYVACPLRYSKPIQYIKENINPSEVYSVRVICSSYLPEWRKGVDYRRSYSARRELGGGVDIDLIHEWDYICYLFGIPTQVYHLKGKYSELEIDSDDLAVYIAKYPDKLIELHLDYFGRENKRTIELYMKQETVTVDINRSVVQTKEAVLHLGEERNDFYLEELRYFFDLVNGDRKCENDIKNALTVLKISKGEV